MKFNEIITKKEILKVIEEKGFVKPTEIQEKIIPYIIDGKDVLGQSQTGTGKTLAFLCPILNNIESSKNIQTLILAPTRELAIQTFAEIEDLSRYTQIHATCVYGSSSIEEQIRTIRRGVEIVVGTPGRVKDLIKRNVLKLEDLKYFVLDEADEMLSMGFQEDLEFIFEKTNKERQVLLFSATMPKQIVRLAKKYMRKDYQEISVITNVATAANIEQEYYIVSDKTRLEAMCRLMDYYNPEKAIIFCRTKRNADEVLERLLAKGYSCDVIHGDITQAQRITTLDRFKNGIFNFLIATDVAARGIDVKDIEVVFNYNLPESNEAYVHRIGRTGRANSSGIAVTFVKPNEEKLINNLEKHIKTKLNLKALPTINDILPTRIDDVIKEVNNIKDDNTDSKMFNDYLETLSDVEIKSVLNRLLEKELEDNLGSNFKIDVTVTKDRKRQRVSHDDDSIRVFATIGKMDNINKQDFLKYIENTADVPMSTVFNVDILTKFTFMNIRKEYYKKVIEKCNNTKYKNRVIKMEKAKR